MEEGDSHRAALWLIDEYDVFVIDIYSCDRPQLVRAVDGVVVECEPEVVSEKISPASGCAIVFRCELLGVWFRFTTRPSPCIVQQCIVSSSSSKIYSEPSK